MDVGAGYMASGTGVVVSDTSVSSTLVGAADVLHGEHPQPRGADCYASVAAIEDALFGRIIKDDVRDVVDDDVHELLLYLKTTRRINRNALRLNEAVHLRLAVGCGIVTIFPHLTGVVQYLDVGVDVRVIRFPACENHVVIALAVSIKHAARLIGALLLVG